MGGAIAAKTLQLIERDMNGSDLMKSIQGIAMINITEGTAREALPHMQEVINQRPTSFPDVLSAIRHGVMSKQVRDKRSAGVSIPSQIVPANDEITGAEKFVWRTDLAATMPFWEQWFADLNSSFLDLQTRKWLFLANKDNLDD